MTLMDERGAWPSRLAGTERRWSESPGARAVVAGILGLAAVTETITRATGDGALFVVVLCLLALAGTLPLTLPRPAVAALVISSANLLSIMPFHTLTSAAVGAQLMVSYRLGRAGPQVLAVGLSVPFLALALADPADNVDELLAILVAALTPMAALAGAAVRRREETKELRNAHADVLGTLLEHTARGERARIARELHDVVAHHVSMIAVQAETARLTTPGMPAAGAQRLSQIGDTARRRADRDASIARRVA